MTQRGAGTVSALAFRSDVGEHITAREQQILSRICLGHSNKEMARELGCALKTVETHVSSLLRKFRVQSRLQLALRLQQRLRVSPDSLE
jgi:two-component system, NarL family, nitrate/nitrite response regulator NarL